MQKIKSFLVQSKRVWHVLRKPSRKEVEMTSKIAGAGIGIIGFGGFAISLFMKIFQPFF